MTPKKYRVTVSRVEYFSTDVVVEAQDEMEARDIAMDEASFGSPNDADQCVEHIQEITDKGELCIDGVRYATKLDEFGCPELHPLLRAVISKADNNNAQYKRS